MATCPIFVRGYQDGKTIQAKEKNKASAQNEVLHEDRDFCADCDHTCFSRHATFRSNAFLKIAEEEN